MTPFISVCASPFLAVHVEAALPQDYLAADTPRGHEGPPGLGVVRVGQALQPRLVGIPVFLVLFLE